MRRILQISLALCLGAICLLVLVFAVTGKSKPRSPQDVMKEDGYLAVLKDDYVYVFYQGGDFASVPFGMSGRMLLGDWTGEMDGKGRVTAIASKGHINERDHLLLSSTPEGVEIVCRIASGHSEAIEKSSLWKVQDSLRGFRGTGTLPAVKRFFKGHFVVEKDVTHPFPGPPRKIIPIPK